MSSRDIFFKECVDAPFAGGYKDAHDWAFDKFKAYNLLDRFDAYDFTFTFDEALENMLLARLAYRDEPSLGEFVVPRDYFWKSVFQRCLAYWHRQYQVKPAWRLWKLKEPRNLS